MENESRKDFLHRQIADRLSRIESSVTWYRKIFFRSQMSTVVLSALITIVAGLKSWTSLEPFSSDIVLVLGALVTVISAFGAFFSPRESWHLNAETYNRLRALQAKLEYAESAQDFATKEDSVLTETFNEYQTILGDYNKKWQELRQKSK